jgi:hypothetical protein
MGVVHNFDSEYSKEMRRWEQFPRHAPSGELLPAGNPYVFRPYPMMLYKAFERPNGKVECMTTPPNPRNFLDMREFERAERDADAFTRECQREATSEAERARLEAQGWRASPTEAIAHFESLQADIAQAAAEAAYRAQGLTAKAKAELAAADDRAERHVVDVKGTKKGPKAVTAVEA